MNRAVHCSLLEKDTSSDSVHIMAECSSGALEENPVQDNLAALICQSFRMKSTVDFQLNLIWTGFNAPFCAEHFVSFWVCLSVVFL